jgi:hypothetical protein
MADEKIHIVTELIGQMDNDDEDGHPQVAPWCVAIRADIIPAAGGVPRQLSVWLDIPQGPQRMDAIAYKVLADTIALLRPNRNPALVDPSTIPDPRRWGTVIETRERVYWDAGYAARGENAWTNVERTKRFSADRVRADEKIPPRRSSPS